MEYFYSGDTPRIRMTTGKDLTEATEVIFRFQSPSGDVTEETCTVETAASGIIYWDAATTDFSECGDWGIQAQLTFATTRYRSRTCHFRVLDAFEV